MNGAKPGQYNVVLKEKYETFDHQIPIEEFLDQLEDGTVFDEVCVLELSKFLESSDSKRLSRALQDRAWDLKRKNATVQFAVEGSFQRVKGGFELKYDDELYRLDSIFGPQLRKHEDGWLVAPFD